LIKHEKQAICVHDLRADKTDTPEAFMLRYFPAGNFSAGKMCSFEGALMKSRKYS